MNAKNYSNELAKELDLERYLTEQWSMFETVYIRKFMGGLVSSSGLGYKMSLPIIGRLLRYEAENMIHSESKNRNPLRADGHFGQVVPLEDAKAILANLAAEPIIENYCMCRMMQGGIKELCCFNYGVLSGVIEKLPRFIPKNTGARIDREKALARLEQHNRAGKVATVWFQPVPYINCLCSCESPQCGGLRLRNDYRLHIIYKSEYVNRVDPNRCQGCKLCVPMCQFGALRYSPSLKRVLIDNMKCFGCGLCRHACKYDALQLVPRESIPGLKGQY